MRLFPVLALLLVFSMFAACKRSVPTQSDPEAFKTYISSYTRGVISSTSPIVVTFTQPYGEQASDKMPLQGVLLFSPEIKGVTEWLDAHTLRFTPEKPLPQGATYMASLELHKLVSGLSSDQRTFYFEFSTREQFADLVVEALYLPQMGKPHNYQLSGEIRTNDHADPDQVKAALQLQGLKNVPPISWTHHEDNTAHRFTIFPIISNELAQEFTLQFKGKAIQADDNLKESILLPSVNDFFVMRADNARDSRSRIDIHFSQLLKPDQELTGLIYLTNHPSIEPRFVVDGNRVQCHFPESLGGAGQLFVAASLRDSRDNTLGQPFAIEIHFTQPPPAVRLVGKGHILPDGDNLLFPFEAINLHSVEVEVFKIFNNNIFQFLQVNRLEGAYELNRVGRIQWKGRVDLRKLNPERNNREYIRYALDLARLIDPDPSAIYQVRIGFWSNCTDYFCDGSDVESTASQPTDPDYEDYGYHDDYYYSYQEGEEDSSLLTAWYGEQGYTRSYRWENRDHPCRPEYYNSDRFVSRNVVASNLGISVKSSPDDKYLVAVHDLRTTKPVANAEVQFLDFQLQSILKAETHHDGIALNKLPRQPHLVVVTKNGVSGYATLGESHSLKVSDFDTDGVNVTSGLRAFIYAERGVWRPGDSIFLNCMLYHPGASTGKDPHPVTMTLYDPRGREVARRVNSQPEGTIYPFHLATSPDAPTGAWHAVFKAGNATFHKYLRVETVKPNRFKLQLTFDKTPARGTAAPLQARLQAHWLHGAPVSNQPVLVDLRAVSIPTQFKNFEKFRFDKFGRLDLKSVAVIDRKTNEQGELRFSVDASPYASAPGKMRLHLKYRVNEPGGGFSQDFKSVEYDPFEAYSGLRVPLNAQNRPVYELSAVQQLQFASMSADGQPLRNRKLEVRISEHTWRWWWERYRNNYTAPNNAEFVRNVASHTVTTNEKGQAVWPYAFSSYGRFVIEVCDPLTGHCAEEEVYVFDRQQSAQLPKEMQYFELETDKKVYAPGEKASFSLPAIPGGHALITLESGRTILEAWTTPLSDMPRKESFTITEHMVPNLYLSVSLFQPHSIERSDLPLRLYSISPITVENPRTRLQPVLKAPTEMRPDKAYTFAVSEKSGRAMTYTLALVDEGLLDLTHFATPDPHKSLFSKEALGVKSWDIYDEVLGGFAGELRRIAAIGGDAAAAAMKGNPKAQRFPPAIVHLGPFSLSAGRTGEHKVQIPNYMGSVRAMVVAANPEAVGAAEQTIPVRKPLMVTATLPRTLGIRENLDIAATLFVTDDAVRSATVQIEEKSGLLRFTNGTKKEVKLSGKGEYTVYFPAEATDKTGIARLTFNVSGGRETADYSLEIDVRNPNPAQTRTVEKLLRPGESVTFTEPLTGTPGTNSVTLNAFGLPPIHLDDKVRQLVEYPFGCLEQTTSRIFPLLYLPEVVELTPERRQFYRSITEQGIQRILSLMTSDGRLQFWPAGGNYHEWSEIWATVCLVQAREAGYPVHASSLKSILDHHKRAANQWAAPAANRQQQQAWNTTQQAWRLYTLALADEALTGAMNRLREYAALQDLDRWLLAAAYARSGRVETARQLTRNLGTDIPDYHDMYYSYGSELRDLGLIGLALLEMGDREKAFQVIRKVAERLNSPRWYSTHSLATGLWAYTAFGQGRTSSDPINIRYAAADGKGEQLATSKSLLRKELSPAAVDRKALTVENLSKELVYVQIALTGQPELGRETEASRGIRFEVSYEGGTKYRNLPVGSDFTATVKVWHIGAGDGTIPEVALSQLLPSGWEIRNVRMDAEGPLTAPPMNYKYRDIRDDRSYTFFDLHKRQEPQVYYLHLTAAYPGRFYLPGQKVEAMYSPDFVASTKGEWVTVYDPGRDR